MYMHNTNVYEHSLHPHYTFIMQLSIKSEPERESLKRVRLEY